MSYRHTQTGWPLRVAMALAALGLLVLATAEPFTPGAPRASLIGGAVFAISLGIVFSRLTIEIGDERVRWWYGVGWPRFSLALAEITAVEATETTFLQGWGIRRTRAGWLYNVAGYGAVRLHRLDGRQTLLGSDEPRRLKAAFDRALARRGRERLRA